MIDVALGPYPGRGLTHLTDRAGASWWVYFVTGRSVSSRARVLRDRGNRLVVEPRNGSVGTDALRHYTCARHGTDALVVGNGDHVDEIVAGLDGAASIDTAMSAIEPEPDPPIWTPRIALVAGPGSSKMLSIYQRAGLTERRIVAVPRAPGCAVLQATYSGTVSDPVGDAPYSVWEESRSLAELCNALYQDCLDASLRVLLVAGPAEPSRGGDAVKVSIALGGAARATSH